MIRLEHFKKTYKNAVIFEDVNITFESQKVTFIMGPNGSGKTTLIKCLLQLERHGGNVIFKNNLQIKDMRENCLVIWDDCPFYLNLSGIKNLLIYAERKISKKYALDAAAKYLNHDVLKRKVKSYSYGQKKKLALALIEILDPEIIIMDEISNGLDYETMQFLKRYLAELSKNKTIILTGHQFDFYNDIIDNLVILKDHNLIEIKEDFKNSGKKLEEIYENELYSKRDSTTMAF